MKKITCLLAALLLVCGLSWAQTIDVLNHDVIGVPNTNYVAWSDLTLTSGAVYAGNTAGGNNAIQMRSNNNNSGIVTTTSVGIVTNITVAWNENTNSARSLNVYGKNVAYSAASDLYGNYAGTLIGTIAFGETELVIDDEYAFIGIRSANGALYLDEIQITWEDGSGVTTPSITASNVEIAYDATEGAIGYTINNPAEDGVLSAETDAEWLTIGTIGETVPFTCTVNDDTERTATVTLTYTYDTDQTITKNVTVTQGANPNAPGSEANPYTVAQARAAIDAGTGTQGVYATGIVSAIPTAYNSQYGNVTFNMVDEEGDEVFLQAYRCGGDEAADVMVGDVVVVYGNLTKYNTTYEFAQGCQVVSLIHPVITEPVITVEPATVNATVEGGEGTLTVTYLNITEVLAEVYFCDAEGEAATYDWIDAEIDDENNVYYVIEANEGDARTAYLKVYALDDEGEDVYSNLVTINQAAYVAPALDYATLPFEFDGGRADIETTDGLTQEGLDTDYNNSPKLKFNTTGDWLLLHFNDVPGTLTYTIKGNSFNGGTFTVQTSEDGETYTDLETYTEFGNGSASLNETFNNVPENARYIKWIYTEKASGNVALGNITLGEYTGPVAVITVEPTTVNATAEGEEGTLTVTYENITEIMAEVHFCDAEGEEATYDWIDAEIDEENNVYYVIDANEGEARTAYLKVYALDNEGEDVYSDIVTINQAAYEVPFEETTYWTVPWIESGRHYIITNGIDKAMGGQNNNNRAAVEVVIDMDNGEATVSNPDVCEVVINGPDAQGLYTIYDANIPGYLYAAGANSSNYLRTETFCDNRAKWFISFDEETGAANIVANIEGRNTLRYNSGNDIFSCYGSGQQDVYLFMKDYDETSEFYTDIKGYGEGDGNWYLLGIPVDGDVNPTQVDHMLDAEFDLYMFNQAAAGEEWQNYKATNFLLSNGLGYLYANSNNITLKYVGDPIFGLEMPLDYEEGAEFAGWNLVGNPFGCAATIDRDFYVMNAEGTELELSGRSYINPFEGVFVEAAEQGESVSFEMEDDPAVIIDSQLGGSGFEWDDPTWNKLNIRVSDNNGHGDFARIRFGEGRTLSKFMLNENNTKLYFVQGDKEFAVVRSNAEGEMPVNFKAAADGTYTLTVSGNIEMEYLYLIDNMTGTEVDLLASPSYSFEATTSDNAARFTLVFAGLTGMDENNADEFAFFSNGSFVISNEGNATLQVIDVTGRIVKSENINGSTSVNVDAAPGVYMLRLTNGDNVKVQKVVIK